jgi:hypothetical protein
MSIDLCFFVKHGGGLSLAPVSRPRAARKDLQAVLKFAVFFRLTVKVDAAAASRVGSRGQ